MDQFNRDWIIENAVKILQEYSGGITIRQLHYRLVSIGMTNDINHYKRVVCAMTKARWTGTVPFSAFLDRDRSMYGETADDEKDLESEIESGKYQVKAWMRNFRLNRWANQPNYVEVWIEKKALQGVFESPCIRKSVGLAPCKGYPSLSFLYDAVPRFEDAIGRGKNPIILYFGDYDPSGQNIPESIDENLRNLGIDVRIIRCALNKDQIDELGLPGAPAKKTDTRSRTWTGGDVVELDAVEPRTLEKLCTDTINHYFDKEAYKELKDLEAEQKIEYQKELKEYVMDMQLGEDDES